ncbi:MAG: Ig-like domain-containing protein [Dysgonamonadaceae bacterium]|jgi:uncharacterized protein YjdB|nr:Ig-like domain-containing protein [Dysgonamonadaceae bacterium]
MKKISFFLIALFFSAGLFAQSDVFKVQGFPRPDIEQQPTTLKQSQSLRSDNFTFDDIILWAGDGSKRAALAVQWNDPRETNAMVWGYQWDGDKYGVDILFDVCKADPKFHVMADATTSGYGSAIAGVGYDANGDGIFFVKNKKTGVVIQPDDNGVIPHPTPVYDYDDYEAGDPEDYWGAGWYSSYWSYWLKADDNASWGYSGVGASGRRLTDGCWDGWNFALGMSNYTWKPLAGAPAPGYNTGTFLLSNGATSSLLSVLDKKGNLTYDIYGTENPSLSLDANAYSATLFGANMYIVSDAHLLVADALKVVKKAEIDISGGRSFVGVNEQTGYLGTSNGIFPVTLGETPALGTVIANTNAETGAMLYSKGFVFAVQKNKGLVVINTGNNTVKKTLTGNYLFLTQSMDGTVWAGAGTLLSRINPETLETWSITLPANAAFSSDWNDWNAKLFFADAGKDVLYWANTGFQSNPTNVFQYKIGQPASIESPFFSLPDEKGLAFSKAAVSLNYQVNQLTVSADKTTGSTVSNKIYLVDTATGDVLSTFTPALNGSVEHITYPDKAAKIDLPGSYTFALNAAPTIVPLDGQLTDADNVAYNITSTVSSDNTDLVTAAVADNKLTITPQAGQSGNAKLTFLATSNGTVSKKNIDIAVTRALEGISLVQKELTMKKNGVDTLDVVFNPANATNKIVTWGSTNTTVATVNATTGAISARNEGETKIYAKSAEGNFTDTCKLTVVNEPLTGISFNKKNTTILINQKDTIIVNFSPADASNRGITWTTDDPANLFSRTQYSSPQVMCVLTGSIAGTTKLRAKSSDGNFVDSCEVTVVFNPATALELNVETVDLTVPNTFALKGTFLPEGSSNTKITWTSRNTAIATVNTAGTVTAVAAGETWVVAQSQDDAALQDSALIKVDFIPLTDFAITSNDTLIGPNQYFYATTSFTPSEASDKKITWTSSDATVATASASGTEGYIRGLKQGTVKIYAETNGTFKDSIQVTVDSIHVTGIAVTPPKEVWKPVTTSLWMPPYEVYPANATNKTVTLKMDSSVVRLYSATMQYLKPHAVGDSWVYYTTNDGGFKDSLLVHITPAITAVTLNEISQTMIVGDVVALTTSVSPEGANPNVTWTSTDPAVASVDVGGNVTALKAGTAKIIAASAELTTLKDTCDVTVNNQIAQSLLLSDTEKTALIGDSWTLTPTVLPANTTNKRLTWTSSDYAVLDVNANGLVKALGKGTATVTAYAKDGGAEQSCTVAVDTLDYTQGVFFVNEDWFGHNNSTINFLTNNGIWAYRVYQRENPGKELGCTSPYAAVYGDKLYITSKQSKDPGASIEGSRLAVVDAKTMKSLKEFANIATDNNGQSVADGRAFLGVDEHKGYIGTSNGIYVYDAGAMEIGAQIEGTGSASGDLYSAQIGTMLRVGGRVFAVNQKTGIVVINPETDEVETVIGAPLDGANQRGFGSIVLSKDGNIWCSVANDVSGSGSVQDYLLKLDPYTLDTTRVALPAGYGVPNSWYAWTADGFCSSKQENTIFWKNDGGWFSSTKIYAYNIDAAQAEEVYNLENYDDGGWGFYGAGFRIDPVTNHIYASLFRSFGSTEYRVVTINPASKTVVAEYPMSENYWFPSIPVFPDNAAPVVFEALADFTVTADSTIYLGDKITDADNMEAAIVKTIVSVSNEDVLSAAIANDNLLITLKTKGESDIVVRFNSNGKTVDKTLTITSDIPTGITGVNTQEIRVYPNPFVDYIIINATESGTAEIFDLSGKTVLTANLKNGNNRIITSALPKGVYILNTGGSAVKIVK